MHGSVSPVRRSGAELVFQLFKEPVGLFIGRTRVRRDGVISGRLAKLREKLCAGGVPELRIQLRNAVQLRVVIPVYPLNDGEYLVERLYDLFILLTYSDNYGSPRGTHKCYLRKYCSCDRTLCNAKYNGDHQIHSECLDLLRNDHTTKQH